MDMSEKPADTKKTMWAKIKIEKIKKIDAVHNVIKIKIKKTMWPKITEKNSKDQENWSSSLTLNWIQLLWEGWRKPQRLRKQCERR